MGYPSIVGSRHRRGLRSSGQPLRPAIDGLLASLLAFNAGAVGVALLGYGQRVATAIALHVPVEIAGLSLAGGADMQASRQPLSLVALDGIALRTAPHPRRDSRDLRLVRRPAMRAPLRVRLLMIPLVWVPAILFAWTYLTTYDLARTWQQLQAGLKITWPPAPKHGSKPAPSRSPTTSLGTSPRSFGGPPSRCSVSQPRSSLAGGCTGAPRARAISRWELRLGRDDLANPYHVQEAFEGIIGAISPRWYERLSRGPDSVALEVHRLPDLSIRFTVAAPRRLEPAIRGPLEDLYPDVEMIEVDGEPTWAGCVVRLKKRRPFLLSIQTTRNYEHAFSESLVALMSTSDSELSVQIVLAPAPALVHRRARTLLKRRERALQYPDKRDPGELGVDPIVEAKKLKGALETQHRSLVFCDVRVSGGHVKAVRRVAGLFSQLSSENEFTPRQMRLRRSLYARRIAAALLNPLPGLRTGVLSTSELATLWQLPRARVKHARIPRATVRGAIAPPEIDRDQARTLLRERGPVAIAPADRKYDTRSSAARGRQELRHGSPLHQRRPRRRPSGHPDRPQGPASVSIPSR